MPRRIETLVRIDGRRVHRFQVVRERREEGDPEDWIVVGFDDEADDGGSGAVRLADPNFEWTREVPLAAFRSGRFVPLVEGAVPVWGY